MASNSDKPSITVVTSDCDFYVFLQNGGISKESEAQWILRNGYRDDSKHETTFYPPHSINKVIVHK